MIKGLLCGLLLLVSAVNGQNLESTFNKVKLIDAKKYKLTCNIDTVKF